MERYARKKILVLDTTAFLAALPLQLPDAILYTTPSVLEEVRDQESRLRLETALVLERVRVVKPPVKTVRQVLDVAKRVGEHGSLSKTDVEVLALALHLSETMSNVVVVTDDYAVQNLAAHLGLDYMPLRTRGIRETRRFVYKCPACGYVSEKPGEKTCPICGTRLVKVRA